MTTKVTLYSNYRRAIIIVIDTLAERCLCLSLSLSRFVTPTNSTIDPMITAENIIVNAYDPLMTMDHSRCQIGSGSRIKRIARAYCAVIARVTAMRMYANVHARARARARLRRELTRADDERI